jgi:hypothetical protein
VLAGANKLFACAGMRFVTPTAEIKAEGRTFATRKRKNDLLSDYRRRVERHRKKSGNSTRKSAPAIRDQVYEGTYGKQKTPAPLLRDFITDSFLPWSKVNKRTWVHDEFRSRPLIKALGNKPIVRFRRF